MDAPDSLKADSEDLGQIHDGRSEISPSWFTAGSRWRDIRQGTLVEWRGLPRPPRRRDFRFWPSSGQVRGPIMGGWECREAKCQTSGAVVSFASRICAVLLSIRAAMPESDACRVFQREWI